MVAGDTDIWVCGNCRSVNNLRAKQCYSCRTPQHLASVDPADVVTTGHGILREIALPEFHASRGEAMLASVLILLVAGMNVISTIVTAQVLQAMASNPDATLESFTTDLMSAGSIALATLGVALLALTAWAYWLSRVVVAMPALGLGYPAANGLMAFVENFLPGFNLFRVPAIVRDVVRRIEPVEGRGEALIFAAWVGLLGGFLIPRIGGFLGVFGSDTLEGAIRNELLIQGIAAGLVLIGAIFLVALIWWIEARISRRRAAQLAGEPAVGSDRTAAAVEAAVPAPVVAPFAPAPAPAVPPAAPPVVPPPTPAPTAVAGPLGAMRPAQPIDPVLSRPITAVTGAASIPTPPPPTPVAEPPFVAATPPEPLPPVAAAPPTTAEPPFVIQAAATTPPVPAPPAELPPAAQTASTAPPVPAQPVPAPTAPPVPAPQVPAGPRLHLRIESATSMIATLDGESEAITLDELRAAADALFRADGSAVIAMAASFEARAVADRVIEAFSHAGVPTALED